MSDPELIPTSSTHVRPEGFEIADPLLTVLAPGEVVTALDEGPKDTFLELTGTLPGAIPADRLRVLVRDPGTLYVYWTTDGWAGHSYRVSCYLDARVDAPGAAPKWSQEVPATGRECWLHVPPGARGTVVLELIDQSDQRTVGRAYFHAPVGKPRDAARQGAWRIPVPPLEPATSATAPDGAEGLPPAPGGGVDRGTPPHVAATRALKTLSAAAPQGSGPVEDVDLEGRLYHGHVWQRPT